MAEEFNPNQSAVDYGESLLASQAANRKKARKRKRKIDRVNQVMAGFSVADQFLRRNALKKVETFTNNLNAEKAHELSNFKQASDFNTELNKYRTENPSINFDDLDQYKKGGLIYNAISNKHADDTRSRYATGVQGSFVDAEGKELSDASTNWQKEIERRTANSIKSLQASYNKHKGYLNTTDIAIKSQYKQILDQGTNDLMSASNTSSIRKLLNKFGITETNNKNLTEIEKGGVKANINPELVKQYNKSFKENAENFKKYKDWLDTKDKGYNLNEKDIEIKATANSELKEFDTFAGPADLVARTFRVVKQDKVQKNTFTTYTSPNLIKLTNTKNANNETPLKGMDIDGNDDVSLTDIWGKLTRDQKLHLENNIKRNYAAQLKKDEKRIQSEDGILGATGSLEEIVEHTKTAILETVSYDIETGEYNVVRYEDLDQLNNAEGKEVPKSISIKYSPKEGVVLVATPVTLATEVIDTLKNPNVASSSKINLVNQIKQKISDSFPDDQEEQKNLFLQEFNTILNRSDYSEKELAYTQVDIESGRAEKLEQTVDIRKTLSEMEKARLSSPTLRKLKRTLPASEYNAKKEASDRADAFLKSFENQFGSLNLNVSTLTRSVEPFAGAVIPYGKLREQQILNLDPDEVQNFLDNYDYTSTEVKKKMINRETQTEPTEKFIKHLADREGSLKKNNKVYLDSLGIPTVGVGHKLVGEEKTKYKVGDTIPDNILNEWLKKDSQTAWLGALKQSKELGIDDLNFIEALASVNFQLGTSWFKIHKNTWKFLQTKEYDKAADEAADSLWFKQSPTRVKDFQAAIKNL